MAIKKFFDAGILGIVEGLTEFIPVSSTGHLIIAESFLNRASANAGVFDIFIQIGAILSVVWARRTKIFKIVIGLPSDRTQQLLALKIIIASVPAVIFGALLHSFIKSVLFSPWVVSISLIIGGVILLFAERFAPEEKTQSIEAISLKTALGIGLYQVVALIPGISRAGATIIGARFLGVERKAATEFSFFLAIPIIFGAAFYDLYKNIHLLSPDDIGLLATGLITAFISGLIVVNRLIDFIGRRGFIPFGWYRIAVGLLVLALLCAGLIY